MTPVKRNGWTLLKHPAFSETFDELVEEVRALKRVGDSDWKIHPSAKRLKRLSEVMFEEIPSAPDADEYRQGKTLGAAHKHWRRAKIGRLRLFFRYDSTAKIIVFGWLNDDDTLRKSGARTDPYEVFKSRLVRGDPPDDWDDLVRAAGGKAEGPNAR